ncbi:hypothetical protein CJO94_17735 (plasmid) [Ralstonia solanacearum]|nr:hypothetical protein CJO94_17735 [Ralstonia solanacearum]
MTDTPAGLADTTRTDDASSFDSAGPESMSWMVECNRKLRTDERHAGQSQRPEATTPTAWVGVLGFVMQGTDWTVPFSRG